jgi:predicted aspartyl protease
MRRSLWSGIVVLAALAATAQGGSRETAGRRTPLRVVAGRLLIVEVKVNGTGPHPFLLDTGATRSLVDEELADRLGLPPLGSVAHESSIGAGSAGLVRGTVTLGRRRWDGALIRARLDSLRDLEPAPRGVVGQDILRLGNWWLDYRGSSLVEDADGAFGTSDLGEHLQVHWHDERPAIDALLPDHSRLRLVLDSAASAPVLFRHLPGDFPAADAGSAVLTTFHGPTTVALASVGPLRAGRASIPRVDAALLGETGTPRAEDGLLPTALFQGIYFDNRGGSVVLNPRRSRLSGIP